MSEEQQLEAQEQAAPEHHDPFLDKAVQMGYNPDKEAFLAAGGKEEDFVDAKTFVDRAPFIKQINTLNKKLDKLNEFNLKLEQNNKIAELRGFQNAYDEIKKQIRLATEVGDVNAVEQLTERAVELKKASEVAEQNTKFSPDQLSASKAFVERNSSWWNQNSVMADGMRSFARSEEARLQMQGVPPDELYNQIEQSIKQRYPEQFPGERVTAKHVISPKESSKSEKMSYTVRDIPDSALSTFNMMKEYRQKRGMKYTANDFFEQYKDVLFVDKK